MKENLCCNPGYYNPSLEAECARLKEELEKRESDYEFVKLLHDEVSRELDRAKAKLEMVYLIFGKGGKGA